MARWMIEHGSDVHQGGDGQLMRAALKGERIPMMELLVSCGADVNAEWHGDFPIIFASCEAVDPEALKWLLDRGANPNCNARGGTALDYVIGTYARSPERLSTCIDLLLDAGGTTRYNAPGVLEVLRRQLDRLLELPNLSAGKHDVTALLQQSQLCLDFRPTRQSEETSHLKLRVKFRRRRA